MPFNLDTAIATWRSVLAQRRYFFTDDLDELERHLRDHTAFLIQQGTPEEEAFHEALRSLGDVVFLEQTYRRVFWRKLKHRQILLKNIWYQVTLFKNYAVIAWRAFMKHKGYSTLNISGLALGLACSFLIVLWMQHELSIDQFHEHGDQLYAVKTNDYGVHQITTWSNVSLPLAEMLETTYPEIEQAILTLPIHAALQSEKHAGREKGYYASPGFFTAFSFPLLVGDPVRALADPTSILISETVAAKYFGSNWRTEQVVGQTLTMDYWQSDGGVLGQAVRVDTKKPFTITGVFKTPPEHSSLQFDVVLPVAEVADHFPHIRAWGPRWFELVVQAQADVDALGAKIRPVLQAHVDAGIQQELMLQPFPEAYLHSAFVAGKPTGGRIQRVYLIGWVGIALLLIACINFTNLVTAQAQQRAREIGVRKVMGATPTSLVQQFLGEALLASLIAFGVAIGLLVVALPLFREVTGTVLALDTITASVWFMFLGIALLAGVLAGSYPAFYLASLQVVRVFRNTLAFRKMGAKGLRKGLVVVQFGVSAFLVVGTLTVYQQLVYLQTKELGLNKDNVVMIRLEGAMREQYDVVRQMLLETPQIKQVARSSAQPLGVATKNSNVHWAGKTQEEDVLFTVLRTDAAFSETMELTLQAGRFFDEDHDANALRYVVNAAAVQAMGLTDPIGHPFAFGFDRADGQALGEIIGVVEDFHTGPLTDEKIAPLVVRYEPSFGNFLLVRVSARETRAALLALEEVHATLNPGYLFEYTFLDDVYQAYYADEWVLGRLSQIFAFIAIFIACLGLLGLSAFAVQQRTKEIGIRRVLGATKRQVLYIVSLEFMQLVGLALVIALPLAYWAMQGWLGSFAYHIQLGAGTLLVAATLAYAVALVTVGYQAHRATRLDPVCALRSE